MSCGRRDTLQCLYHRTTMSVHYNVGDQQETIPLTCNCQGCSGSQICSCSCLMIMRRMQPIFQWCPRNLSIATRCSFLHELSVCGNRWFNPEVIWELTGEGHEFVHCTHPWIPNFSLDCFLCQHCWQMQTGPTACHGTYTFAVVLFYLPLRGLP